MCVSFSFRFPSIGSPLQLTRNVARLTSFEHLLWWSCRFRRASVTRLPCSWTQSFQRTQSKSHARAEATRSRRMKEFFRRYIHSGCQRGQKCQGSQFSTDELTKQRMSRGDLTAWRSGHGCESLCPIVGKCIAPVRDERTNYLDSQFGGSVSRFWTHLPNVGCYVAAFSSSAHIRSAVVRALFWLQIHSVILAFPAIFFEPKESESNGILLFLRDRNIHECDSDCCSL
jgi:hypothetical protein